MADSPNTIENENLGVVLCNKYIYVATKRAE